jgi:two-component system OmpR family response regulator
MSFMQILPRVLLTEDDRSIAGALAHALQNNYDVDIAATGQLALYKTEREAFDIIVLDLNLPDIPGILVCQQLRQRGVSAPILILSGEDRILTKITLLDAGANDYLTKPFSLGELKARLRALTRIASQVPLSVQQLQVSGIELDRQSLTVTRDGIPISLRRKEFRLLECLMEHAGSVVSRETLKRYVWQGSDDLWTNTVDVHIKYLRDKLDRPFSRSLIQTVHGIGYKLEALQPIIVENS